jgi:hypothetical protein
MATCHRAQHHYDNFFLPLSRNLPVDCQPRAHYSWGSSRVRDHRLRPWAGPASAAEQLPEPACPATATAELGLGVGTRLVAGTAAAIIGSACDMGTHGIRTGRPHPTPSGTAAAATRGAHAPRLLRPLTTETASAARAARVAATRAADFARPSAAAPPMEMLCGWLGEADSQPGRAAADETGDDREGARDVAGEARPRAAAAVLKSVARRLNSKAPAGVAARAARVVRESEGKSSMSWAPRYLRARGATEINHGLYDCLCAHAHACVRVYACGATEIISTGHVYYSE